VYIGSLRGPTPRALGSNQHPVANMWALDGQGRGLVDVQLLEAV